MADRVTGPPPLDRQTAQLHLEALARPESSGGRWPQQIYKTDREWAQGLLDLVNGGGPISDERRGALRAFLEERVAVRERVYLMSGGWVKDAARGGYTANVPPQRTLALLMAWETLPQLLNRYVDSRVIEKQMRFENAGAARTVKGTIKGKPVTVTLEGRGGELAVAERVVCHKTEAAINYALAVLLAKDRNLGPLLCRCHAEGCGRFWLLPEKLTAKPSRNFCALHEKDKKRLSDAERKRRQREKHSKKVAISAAKHK